MNNELIEKEGILYFIMFSNLVTFLCFVYLIIYCARFSGRTFTLTFVPPEFKRLKI